MTEQRSEIESALRGIVRFWPIVLITVAVCAALFAFYATATAPEATTQATVGARVINATGLPLAPNADTVVAAALGAKEEALALLGEDAATGAGSVSAAVDSKDKNVVRIVVTHTDPEFALPYAEAVRSVATSAAMEPLAPTLDYYAGRVGAYEEQLARWDEVIAAYQAAAKKNPGDAGIAAALTAAQATRDAADQDRRQMVYEQSLYQDSVVALEGGSSEPVAQSGSVLSAGLQGAVVGLFAGLIVAFVADRMRRRSA